MTVCGSHMKAKQRRKTGGDMRPEYDFSKGARGKYYKRTMEKMGKGAAARSPDVPPLAVEKW